MKKHWKIAENYHTRELILKSNHILYKDWFDPGKNPNKQKLSFEDILTGKYDYLINTEFNSLILREIKETIQSLPDSV